MQLDENKVHDLLGNMGDEQPLSLNLYDQPAGAEFARRRDLRQLLEDILHCDHRVKSEFVEPHEYASGWEYTLYGDMLRLTRLSSECSDTGDEWSVEARNAAGQWEDVTEIAGMWHAVLRQKLKVLALTKPQPAASDSLQAAWS